jgi:Rieske Fe-S protein
MRDTRTDSTMPDSAAEHADTECAACEAGARSRRDVLALAGSVVVGGGLLAACGGSNSAAPAPGLTSAAAASAAAASAAPTSTAPTSTAPSTGPTSAAATSAGATAKGFSVPTADVPVGGGKIYDAQQLVITQPTAGTFKAFSAVCPHQGCLVSAIENGQIQCPCHASRFAITDGAVLGGPAPTGLPTEKVTVAGATVTVPS